MTSSTQTESNPTEIPGSRVYRGTAVPEPGVYDLDQAHTAVEFVARHLMITKVRGRFGDVTGSVHIAEVPEESSVEVTIGAGSVASGNAQRDEHLRSPDFLDVEHYPTLSFKSTRVEVGDEDHWRVTGDLTIVGNTRPVVLDVEFDGASVTPWGTKAVAFSASTEIDREDWGLTYNMALETGGVVVSRKVRIELSVEAILRQEEGRGAA